MRQVWSRLRKLNIGVIGDGTHSLRIQKILKESSLKFRIYKPIQTKNKKRYSSLAEIEKCDVIFILSPNSTHFDYLKKFGEKSYIFCEKPPTNQINELNKLYKFNPNKIYFNYNFRYSKLGQIIKKINKDKFGKFQYCNIITSHNLAQKKNYLNSWRSKKKLCPKGVFEVVSIHWIDFSNYYFKIKKLSNIVLKNTSKVGNSFDNSHVSLSTNGGGVVNIFTSYNSPYCNNATFIYENGIIKKDEKFIKIYGPAKNENKKGFTISPKLIKSYKINEEKDYNDSLKFNVIKFLDVAVKKKSFNKYDYLVSLESNSLIL